MLPIVPELQRSFTNIVSIVKKALAVGNLRFCKEQQKINEENRKDESLPRDVNAF